MMSLKLKKYQLLLLAVLSGVLMSLSWFPYGYAPVMFIAWIPLLIVEKYIGDNPSFFSRGSSVLYSYVTLIIWNVVDTWWVAMSTVPGGIAAFVLNALFMSLVFGLFHVVRTKVFKSYNGYFTLIFFWIAYEYLHLDWDLSWSWLVLGNVFAPTYTWVQWYEFTGVFGGSLWVLLVNILIFIALTKYSEYKIKLLIKFC